MNPTEQNQLMDTPTTEQDLQMLPQMITSWKQVQEESVKNQQQARELKSRKKVLEEMILRIMKKHQIGALDLKQSNGRLLYRKKQTKGPLSQRTLQDMLAEHLKSEDAAKKAIAFIDEKRGVKTMETLTFENL
jgi:hypothetical protein